MNDTIKQLYIYTITLCVLTLFTINNGFAQTKGLIYKPASNGGNLVLDPNGDGYVSKSKSGFAAPNDEGDAYSEIPYRPLPAMINEPLNDLVTGSGGGHTDLAPSQSAGATGSPIAAYFDGRNFMFRIRLGGQSTASKGYSVMIDSDGLYGNLVQGGQPSKTPNPGFEFEVVLASNFDVAIYDHRNKPEGSSTKLWSGSVDQYFQKSIAASTDSLKGNDDYFYDFYVPLSAFPAGTITASTKLRMSGITITSAQSGITGTVSDVGGVDFSGTYGGNHRNAWRDVINSFPAVSLKELNEGVVSRTLLALPPVVTNPIKSVDISINGNSVEPAGSTITVYKTTGTGSPVLIGTTTVSATGTWVINNIALGTLNTGDKITATVTVSGKTTSVHSQHVTVITPVTLCTTTLAPTISGTSNGNPKTLLGTTPHSGNQTFKLYEIDINGQAIFRGNLTKVTISNGSWNSNEALGEGKWAVTVTPAGKCESPRSNELCYNGNGTSAPHSAPEIDLPAVSYVDLKPYRVYGYFKSSTDKGETFSIFLYVNGIKQTVFATSSSSDPRNPWFVDVSNLNLQVGDFVSFRALESKRNGKFECIDLASSPSNFRTIKTPATAPTITGGPYCDNPTTNIKGTSLEPNGTKISLYKLVNNIETLVDTSAKVNNWGEWEITGLTLTPDITYYARQSSASKFGSAGSNILTIGTAYSGSTPTINAVTTIEEGDTIISGKATAGTWVTLYINGEPYVDASGTVLSVQTSGTSGEGNWVINNISPFELYAGAKLSVSAKTSQTSVCESVKSTEVEVACIPASTAITATFSQARICPNTIATIKLSATEPGTIYSIYRKIETEDTVRFEPFGSSALGTGKSLFLYSLPVSEEGTVLLVKTIKVGAPCQYNIGSEMTVLLYPPVPRNFTLIASNTTSPCGNLPVVFTLKAAEAGYKYQLIIVNANKDKIGPAIEPTQADNGKDIVFPQVKVDKTTTYGVVITGVTSGCVADNLLKQEITITGGPDLSKLVSASATKICVDKSASINVETQDSTYQYKIFQQGNATALATFKGNGATVDTTLTAPFTTTGVKNFYVTVTGGGCYDLKLTATTQVEVVSGFGETVSAGSPDTICVKTFTTLNGSNPVPGSGIWTVKSSPDGTSPSFANNTNRNTRVDGLTVSGEYVFTWTVTSSCNESSASSDVTITVNCPALANIKSTSKYVPKKPADTDSKKFFQNGDVLVDMSDEDGGIVSAMIVPNKGLIPPGTSFNTSTGQLVVDDRSKLIDDNYFYTVRTKDKEGFDTNTPISLRMYSMSAAPAPLSVELAYFVATYANNKVNLQWATASEENNDRFEIERSLNGSDFERIGIVKGNGTTNQTIRYTYADNNITSGTIYYRLKQVDFDGTQNYSKVVAVFVKQNAQQVIQAYPNPFSKELMVAIVSDTAGEVAIQLQSTDGQTVYTTRAILEKGFQELSLPLNKLSQGMYILRVTGNGINQALKVMKTH